MIDVVMMMADKYYYIGQSAHLMTVSWMMMHNVKQISEEEEMLNHGNLAISGALLSWHRRGIYYAVQYDGRL